MDVRVELKRNLSIQDCGVGEDSWDSLGLKGDPTSPSSKKSVLNIHWKDRCWSWNQHFGHLMWRTNSFEKTLILGKIESRRRRGDRGWDGWMASLTRWTRLWASYRNWCWTGKPGMLQSMGLQKVRHDWVTELTGYNKAKLIKPPTRQNVLACVKTSIICITISFPQVNLDI